MKVTDEMVERATVYLVDQTDMDGEEAGGLAFEMLRTALADVPDVPAWVEQLAADFDRRSDEWQARAREEPGHAATAMYVATAYHGCAAELRARARQP